GLLWYSGDAFGARRPHSRRTGRLGMSRSSQPSIGFVGFGEAGFNIAKGLKAAGISRISAFDIHKDTPKLSEIIRRRAMDADIPLVNSNRDLAATSDVLFSTVTCAR